MFKCLGILVVFYIILLGFCNNNESTSGRRSGTLVTHKYVRAPTAYPGVHLNTPTMAAITDKIGYGEDNGDIDSNDSKDWTLS